ncbi:L-histidine N(alpha)-methyltransferase [Balneolaceae bacterium YR4-1]|uniref:L-histidine N(Alpha)-methyltransferase n=2 Tax=Halalkalibaculum roseum TaxID=2709311 RepID=A0A6M1SWD6_9BACT|nr:L-histidine N(alpha)-methyltransferase [Halalkalibaculum roseum]
MFEEVIEGLRRPQKMIPSKFFYDERGSELFDEITRLDEYYPTRTETRILEENIEEIAGAVGEQSVIVELGSGNSTKTRLLLDHMADISAYVPVDISEEYLMKTVRMLKKEYPDLSIKPVCADYTKPFQIPPIAKPFEYYVIFYPGSTIGNFRPEKARLFLKTISKLLVPGGGMLIGVDLKKDRETLEAAYNDSRCVTAEFNLNMLVRMNRELNADFDVDEFEHLAFYNEEKGRIEMHLVSRQKQEVHLQDEVISIDEGETIHTENSYKYSLEEFRELVKEWFEVQKVWTDEKELFSMQYLVKK